MKKYQLILSMVVIIILSGAFYWYEYRPSDAKKFCANYSKTKASDQDLKASEQGTRMNDDYNTRYNNYFIRCLNEKGI